MGIDASSMSDHSAALAAADAVEGLRNSLGLPGRLRDMGVPEEGLELIAAATLKDRSLRWSDRLTLDGAVSAPLELSLSQATTYRRN